MNVQLKPDRPHRDRAYRLLYRRSIVEAYKKIFGRKPDKEFVRAALTKMMDDRNAQEDEENETTA